MARDAPLGAYPPRSAGHSEARARYETWKQVAGLPDEPLREYTAAEKAAILASARRSGARR